MKKIFIYALYRVQLQLVISHGTPSIYLNFQMNEVHLHNVDYVIQH